MRYLLPNVFIQIATRCYLLLKFPVHQHCISTLNLVSKSRYKFHYSHFQADLFVNLIASQKHYSLADDYVFYGRL